jgi:hypothetical protein
MRLAKIRATSANKADTHVMTMALMISDLRLMAGYDPAFPQACQKTLDELLF